ncbi:uncharacterized protein LOC106177002 isoform X1 [Lingula anatina]|uniref:Uncharacterized protein LOC106177002 isoform X1 n=1 Tax=Lingula anatina TaxID=7574 RepID=A0A1S3JYG3_LINAN|nr:uncharacterized protein LOC106177002 isoform X1 [Lingula anatina]XP_013415072.1 uncharacterized protein LOC106177002 isoform X1 [Lingula anatina]|eukprot:XP_013415071.1 uncharacterized protein LOC106177002 isoform X1 [Lingula anatina]
MGCGASSQPAPRYNGNKAYPVQQHAHQQHHLQQQKPTQHVHPTPQQKAHSSLPQIEKKEGKCDKIVRAASSCSLISRKSVKSKSSASTTSSRSSLKQLAPANNTVAAAPVATSQSQQQPAEKPKPTPVITDNSPEEKTEIEMKSVDINKELLEKYMALEKEIHEKENKNVVKALQVKKKEVAELSDTIQQLEEHYKKCVEQTKKEKADVDNAPSVQQLLNAEEYQAMLTKEQEEYLDAVNNEEIAKKQLVGVTAQRDKVAKEVEEMKLAAEALQKLYKEQDELLASVFNGKYGSEKEYKLESELDMLLDHHQRVSVAKFKWQNARTLLQHGCNQLSFACKKWLELLKVQPNDVPRKYTITTETRNNLIAASQNITSAQRYLHGITFPYCTKAEMDTLNKATTNIYSDMNTGERHQHAYQCYITTYKRCAALIQWFDHVINNTINKDIANATKKVNEKEKELRQERVTLLVARVKEVLGTDVDFTVSDENMFDDSVEEKELVDIIDADAVSTNGEDVEKPEGVITGNELAPGDNDSISATPLPLNELAPPPSQEDLFGDIEELKKQHEREMEEFQRAQEINKARMDQGLQEKLKARRSRRQRQEALEVSS